MSSIQMRHLPWSVGETSAVVIRFTYVGDHGYGEGLQMRVVETESE